MSNLAIGRPRVDRIGQSFGRLVVIGSAHVGNAAAWVCACSCSALVKVRTSNLARTRSCGCLQRESRSALLTVHGDTVGRRTTAEFRTWCAMRARCSNPKSQDWKYYGARGIAVCERWRSFGAFLEDMGRKPSPSHSIDRKDGSSGYSKENCRWATPVEQTENRRKWGTA